MYMFMLFGGEWVYGTDNRCVEPLGLSDLGFKPGPNKVA